LKVRVYFSQCIRFEDEQVSANSYGVDMSMLQPTRTVWKSVGFGQSVGLKMSILQPTRTVWKSVGFSQSIWFGDEYVSAMCGLEMSILRPTHTIWRWVGFGQSVWFGDN
jgi:hypothetical protein